MPFNNSYNPSYKPRRDFGPRKNEYIRVPEILVIDQEGNNLGVMKTYEALKLAREVDLDLVEVSPNVRPPVCRIIDFAKYMYEQKKKERQNRAITREMKEFVFSPVIDIHDKETRIRRAKDFLSKGHQVRITMKKKGRQSPIQAQQVFAEILTNFADYITIEPEPKREGNRQFITYKPNGKAKNKQDSDKENKVEQPKREPKKEDNVQQISSTPSKNKTVKKIEKKKDGKRSSSKS